MKHEFLIPIVVIVTALLVVLVGGCTSEATQKDEKNAHADATVEAGDKPLNLSVYIDLSDRLIKQPGAVPQMENDTAIINCIFELFLDRCKKNILKNEDHFQVFFYPVPTHSNINLIAKSLNLDLGKAGATMKKKAVKEFQNTYKENLETIYTSTMNSKKWVGSDIWGFFSNKKVDQLCIKDGYRNVLVILTDGYLFYEPNKIKQGNQYSYILPQTLNNPKSSLIVKRGGLEGLEVLMLEISPKSPTERERMTQILSDWFSQMGVQKFVVNEADVSANTEAVITNFLKG